MLATVYLASASTQSSARGRRVIEALVLAAVGAIYFPITASFVVSALLATDGCPGRDITSPHVVLLWSAIGALQGALLVRRLGPLLALSLEVVLLALCLVPGGAVGALGALSAAAIGFVVLSLPRVVFLAMICEWVGTRPARAALALSAFVLVSCWAIEAVPTGCAVWHAQRAPRMSQPARGVARVPRGPHAHGSVVVVRSTL